MKLILFTQDYEWYGENDAGADSGERGRWKPKFGSEIEVATLTNEEALDSKYVRSVIEAAKPHAEIHNGYTESTVIGHEIYADDELTPHEKLISDMYGKLKYPVRVIMRWDGKPAFVPPAPFENKIPL